MNIAIVGSNRGIGLSLVKKLMEKGETVYAFCRKSSKELEELNPEKIITDFEVTDLNEMRRHLNQMKDVRFDALYHVSGIMKSTSIENLDEDAIMTQLRVNSLAPLLSVQAFLPHLNKGAKIGLLTSRMGSVEDNTSGGAYGYRMSKSALNAAGKSLALDLKDQGYPVFLLHPGWVKTDMTGQTGQVTPDESALGLIEIMTTKTLSETGSFWHMNGEKLPW